MVPAEEQSNPAPAEPAAWTGADADAARLALELECLLTDRDMPAATVSRWWGSAQEALELHRARMDAEASAHRAARAKKARQFADANPCYLSAQKDADRLERDQ